MLPLELPVLQSWTCHNCSGCCRQHLIELSDEEHARIEKQGWTTEDGIPDGQAVVERMSSWPAKPRYRLAHQSDGSCVFLAPDGLCRIHAKFGEAAKPLACRIYPYVFHPAGDQIAVSLRFSCPSVVANRGQALVDQRKEIQRTARLVVPKGIERDTPPSLHGRVRLNWADTRQIVEWLDTTLDQPRPIQANLLHALRWLSLLEKASLDTVRGDRLTELLEVLTTATMEEPEDQAEPQRPQRLAGLYFRLLAGTYARRDTVADLSGGLKKRWQLLVAARKFASGRGNLPTFQEGQGVIPFAELERPRSLPIQSDERLRRLLRVKVQGWHFCGRGFYGVSMIEGFRSLALEYAVILWMSRWLSASAGSPAISIEQLERAIAIVDHHHGFSPALGQRAARSRVRQLEQMQAIEALIRWYGLTESCSAEAI